MLLPFPSTFSSSKQKLKHKLNITKKKTKNSHKALHKIEEDLEYADHAGKVEENEYRLEQLVVKTFPCAQFEKKKTVERQ